PHGVQPLASFAECPECLALEVPPCAPGPLPPTAIEGSKKSQQGLKCRTEARRPRPVRSHSDPSRRSPDRSTPALDFFREDGFYRTRGARPLLAPARATFFGCYFQVLL